jgi:hypothetical protein
MPDEDRQAYSLLQLRLSRTESFFKDHNGTDPREFFDIPLPRQDTVKDETQLTVATSRKPAINQPKQPPRQMSAASEFFVGFLGTVCTVVLCERKLCSIFKNFWTRFARQFL